MPAVLCPECGSRLHRSHTQGFGEKLLRALTHYRAYRCHQCEWRGWLGRQNRKRESNIRLRILATILAVLAVIAITLFTLRIGNSPSPPAVNESQLVGLPN